MSQENISSQRDLFFEYLFNDPECYQDTRLAFDKAGYEPSYYSAFIGSVRDDIIRRSADQLVSHTPRAVSKLIDSMDEDGTIPKADIRLKAVESVLDRVGITKKQDVSLSIEGESPIFFIPSKVNNND